MAKIIGIDLGTTNSLVAIWENGESKLLPNTFGEYLTPSVVNIDENGVVHVGKIAKEKLATDPANSASVFKRYMGTNKRFRLRGREFLPEELSALVLRKLKEDAERYLNEPVEEAVISVPAYFNDKARKATKRAGALAGLKVDRIINEPSAAALACHNQQGVEQSYLVFDFGGGTLDVSLVDCFDNIIEIMAVSGDNHLGGHDFDMAIANIFSRAIGKDFLKFAPELRAIILSSAEKCKIALSEEKSVEMVVNCGDFHEKVMIGRKDVVEECADLFERINKPIAKVLLDGGMNQDTIGEVILVGGSCKMHLVKQYLRKLLPQATIGVMEPDYIIAKGCGTYAGIKERNTDIKDMLLTDICPFSLGTGIVNHEVEDKPLMSVIIERNSPLPTSVEHWYENAHDKQAEVKFEVYQGESMYAKDNICLGEMMISIPPLPKGTVRINVRYTYDINGVLDIDIKIPITGQEHKMVIVDKELGMSDEEVQSRLEQLKRLKDNPEDDEENKYVLEWASRLYMQTTGELKEEIAKKIQYFNYMMKKDIYKIKRIRKYISVFLAYVEEYMNNVLNLNYVDIRDSDWYEDDDREEDDLFKKWRDEDK